jgi:ATP-dependent Clp protease ATP-binding subunit ClpA
MTVLSSRHALKGEVEEKRLMSVTAPDGSQEKTLPEGLTLAQRGTNNPLDAIENDLRGAIYGQSRAIDSIMRALNRARLGFSAGNTSRPRVNLLFLGPTGVGKSECAKRLAARLHPRGGGFLRIDCSLFNQGHEVSALLGAPPSYVGRDQKPLLHPDIIETENSVVLFDEIEKGTPELWNLLLQIMEEGEITLLNSGRTVSFHNALLIMTTNVGAKEMVDFLDHRKIGFRSTRSDMEATGKHIYQIGFESLQRVFTPEWINRIDEIVAFRPLASDSMNRIFDRMIAEANEQYLVHGVQVEVMPEAKYYMLQCEYNPRYGARPLRARLLKDIDAPLADLMASGGIPEGSDVVVAYNADRGRMGQELVFYYRPNPELAIRGQERRDLIEQTRRKRRESQETMAPSMPRGPAKARSIEDRGRTNDHKVQRTPASADHRRRSN